MDGEPCILAGVTIDDPKAQLGGIPFVLADMRFLSLGAFGISGLLALAFGMRYLLTREFMPYHAAVLGRPWSELEPRLQSIILGMLKVAGGGLLGYGVALLWLLVPLNRGEMWAVWAAATVSLVVVLPSST